MRSIRWTCTGRQKDASEWIDIQPQRLSRIEEKNQFSLEKSVLFRTSRTEFGLQMRSLANCQRSCL